METEKSFNLYTRDGRKIAKGALYTVAFRKFEEGDVIAIFTSCKDRGNFLSFQHLGQHSNCAECLLTELEKATPQEYSALKKELESAPYNYRLEIIEG